MWHEYSDDTVLALMATRLVVVSDPRNLALKARRF